MSKQLFTTNKIIIYVIVFSVAMIASLLISHHKKPTTPLFNPNDGTIFTVARDINSFKLVSDKNELFSPQNLHNHWTILFFGFTHCDSICPTTLGLLNRVYQNTVKAIPALQIVLISLDPERDTPQALASYVHSFNPAFIGATGKIQELRKLQSQLGVFSARDTSKQQDNYQIQHTSSIFLINPEGKWAGVFRYSLNPQQFSQNLIVSVKTLSESSEISTAQ